MEIPYENLNLIPKLLNAIENLQVQVDLLQEGAKKLDLTKPTNVAEYLGLSKPTIYNYIKDGTFKEGYHFTKSKTDRIKFVEDAIIEFRKG